MNTTLQNFGYPESLLREYSYWAVLLRPQQITLGSLIVACMDDVRAWPAMPSAAFSELKTITSELEGTLRLTFRHDRINYLMLMMVDPHVHFHVIPRYSSPRIFDGKEFVDEAWPGPPHLARTLSVPPDCRAKVREMLSQSWLQIPDNSIPK